MDTGHFPLFRLFSCVVVALTVAGCNGRAVAPAPVAAPPQATATSTAAAGAGAESATEPTASAVAATATVAETAMDTVADSVSAPPVYGYNVLQELPHDMRAYTQGLVYAEGVFYESTGLRGQSTLRRVDPASGQILNRLAVPEQYFAEGLELFEDRLYQLTWQGRVGFIYALEEDGAPVKVGEFTYASEGWGLTHNGAELILSDGTDTLYFLNPASFAVTRQIKVRDGETAVTRLNELEYIDGSIYANVWMTDRIAVIDPSDGRVTAWIDLTGLLADADRAAMLDAWANAGVDAGWVQANAVLNGIAYDEASGRLYVTGKLWPKVYVVELEEP